MRYATRYFVCVTIAILLVGSCFTAFEKFAPISSANAASLPPVSNMEYGNGTIVPANSPLRIWYDWVNVSGTQVINYAMYTTPDYLYSVPIANLVGQHFLMEDGTQVFVASGLSKFEIFRDLNGDGIPQADFTSGNSEGDEIMYYMFMNMSDSYSMIPIEKVMEDSTPHYKWGFTYTNAYAYPMRPTNYSILARLIFNHITLSYDFSVNGNVSNLKINFDIGEISSLNIFDPEFSLDNLGLTLLFAASTYTSKPYSTYVNGQPYNSNANSSGVDMENAQVTVQDVKAYDFVFGGNYSLNRNENIEIYEVKTEAASLSSIPNMYGPELWQMGFFRDQLNLTGLFGGSWPQVNFYYDTSPLIYRICFPVWDGMQIVHDPVYIGYVSTAQIPEFPTTIAILALVTATSLILVLSKLKTKKRSTNYSAMTS